MELARYSEKEVWKQGTDTVGAYGPSRKFYREDKAPFSRTHVFLLSAFPPTLIHSFIWQIFTLLGRKPSFV